MLRGFIVVFEPEWWSAGLEGGETTSDWQIEQLMAGGNKFLKEKKMI